ncbi:MAG: hypothetical protein R2788_26345 [Saprospiraceae bacterium]
MTIIASGLDDKVYNNFEEGQIAMYDWFKVHIENILKSHHEFKERQNSEISVKE